MKTATETAARELRRDPITGGWVIVAAELAREPGQFLRPNGPTDSGGGTCRLCNGQEGATPHELLAFRDGGAPNEPGWRVRVIPNFAPVLRVEGTLDAGAEGPYDRMNGVGAHEILVESPEHGRRLSGLSTGRITEILLALRERIVDLRRDHRLRYIAAFKNHEEPSSPCHLGHGQWQIVGLPMVPARVKAEVAHGLRYFEEHERCMMCDVMHAEEAEGRRVIAADGACVVMAPYASRVPFETWIVPRGHESHFESSAAQVFEATAEALRRTLRKMDAVLEQPAYHVTLQSAPVQEGAMEHAHWRIEIAPRVARGAGEGFEWGTQAYVNPTAPEEAARFLREAAG